MPPFLDSPPVGDQPEDRLLLGHGSGGVLSRKLLEECVLARFCSPLLAPLDDSAVLEFSSPRVAFTTDAYVVRPLVFPGGDIGRLAVCGTVNDLAVMGATPQYLSCALILEEGLPRATLEQVLDSLAAAAAEAHVELVTGDTKVVNRGAVDQLFVITAGVGTIPADRQLGLERIQPGDRLVLSGTLGDHGTAVLASREAFDFHPPLHSDCAPLADLVDSLLHACPGVRFLRDPTRGGLAATTNEIAAGTGLSVVLDEQRIAVSPAVRAFCEALGLDPLYVANEGKVVAVVAPAEAEQAVATLQAHPRGEQAAVIGKVEEAAHPTVRLRTPMGGERLVELLTGEPLPRIC